MDATPLVPTATRLLLPLFAALAHSAPSTTQKTFGPPPRIRIAASRALERNAKVRYPAVYGSERAAACVSGTGRARRGGRLRLRAEPIQTQAESPVLSSKATTIRSGVEEGLKIYEAGDFQKALKAFKQCLDLPAQSNDAAERQAVFYDMACCYSRLGMLEEGMEALQQAVSLGYDEAKQIMSDKDLAPLRKASGFQELVAGLTGGDSVSSSTGSLELEAEVRNPFRKFRQFVWGGAAIASGLGSVVSLSQTIGAMNGAETIPLEQAGQNLAINTAIAIGMAGLLRVEGAGNMKDKDNIQEFRTVLKNATNRVKQMSGLKITVKAAVGGDPIQRGFGGEEASVDNSRQTTLRELRAGDAKSGPRKVVILAGNGKFITESLKNARKADAKGVSVGESKFAKNRVTIIPVVMADPNSNVLEMPKIGGKGQLAFVAVPQEMPRWRSLLAQEFKYGYDQGNANIFRDGIVMATDEVGRVVQRGVGMPTIERWEEAFEKWWKV